MKKILQSAIVWFVVLAPKLASACIPGNLTEYNQEMKNYRQVMDGPVGTLKDVYVIVSGLCPLIGLIFILYWCFGYAYFYYSKYRDGEKSQATKPKLLYFVIGIVLILFGFVVAPATVDILFPEKPTHSCSNWP